MQSEKMTTVIFFLMWAPEISSPSEFPESNTVWLALVPPLSTRDSPGPGMGLGWCPGAPPPAGLEKNV